MTHAKASRRAFLKKTAEVSAMAGLMSGLPSGWVGSVYADDSPETKAMRFGIIALTDCAPIVMAHELGYFKKFGIDSVVSKEASWAVIRDKMNVGENQGTHMLIGMPLASTMGLAGSPVKPMVIPWLLNRNGQAITLNNKLKQAGVKGPKDVKPLADRAKAAGDPLAFAMTFPPGTHAMWMRYWLASGGIHPDKDVSLITIPPPQMVANMKVDKMDGFCVGEPWNARAIADGIGFTSITTQQMWRDHPEKVCAFTEEFATKNPKTVKAALKALHLASVYLDKLDNRPKAAEIISRPTYINCPPEIILGRLLGKYEYGDGRKEQDPYYMIYSDRNCNYPQPSFATWWLTQFRRWGMVKGAPDYAGVSKRVMRPDIYMEAMKEMGVSPKVEPLTKWTFWDGVAFDAANPEKYALVVSRKQHLIVGDHSMNLNRIGHMFLPLVGIVLAGLGWWYASTLVTDLPSPMKTWEESKLYILEPWAKRGEMDQGMGLLAYYSLIRVARGFFLGILIATPLGFLLGVSDTHAQNAGPCHPGVAPHFAAGVAAARPRHLPEVRTRRLVCDRRMLDVADRVEHHGRRPRDSTGLLEHRQGPPSLACDDLHEDRSAGCAASDVHGVQVEPWHRMAGDRRKRDVDRHAWRRRISLAGVQQPDLLAHSPRHPDDRHRRIPARPHDGRGRSTAARALTAGPQDPPYVRRPGLVVDPAGDSRRPGLAL